MSFITDKQTMDDLNIFGKRGKSSVYSIFNRTATKGGAEQLEIMFRLPLNSVELINNRIQTIRFFKEQQFEFFGRHELFEATNLYFSLRDNRSRLTHEDNSLSKTIRSVVNPDADLQLIRKGIHAVTELLQELKSFLNKAGAVLSSDHPWQEDYHEMKRILEQRDWEVIFRVSPKKISFEIQAQIDHLLRFKFHNDIQRLMHYCSMLDVYISIAKVAGTRGFIFPEPIPQKENILDLTDVYHPELEKPIANSVTLSEKQNLLFLTGANMAGKSTFMKSLGISLYLAHMGFPVPAAAMRFSVRDGLFTTINLSDNLNAGFSHFYAEVMRVKKIASALQKGMNVFVLIDELFRGTNVKDAHDATIAIASGFAKRQSSLFVVSTHIMEAGEILQKRYPQISFQYLPTRMEEDKPIYPRKLEAGISADRHGMIIIQNEGILEMLNRSAAMQAAH